ncbi:MAG: class I SAM-dependent methyltransferase [Desulfitobacteriaceae bacterium]|nr:class I SAM-dependent methyltransferase [Desulfitobacteriaceae bacterium]
MENDRLVVDDQSYPIVDDVIILLDPAQYPPALNSKCKTEEQLLDFAEDIQFTFSEEWKRYPEILPEHENAFLQYFDLVNLSDLSNSRVCDLGCGIGRWSFFLTDKCRELVLLDFSEAIFVARNNLRNSYNAIFFMGDIKRLPFRNDFADFLFCLGVLHHLPTNALDEVRNIKKSAPNILIYLYYALDNRPLHFRILLSVVSMMRRTLSKARNPLFRSIFTWVATVGIYMPLIYLGRILKPVGLAQYIPLYEAYNRRSFKGICQDVYDRFFTRIEQRFSKTQINALVDTFASVTISPQMPYWHFICKR